MYIEPLIQSLKSKKDSDVRSFLEDLFLRLVLRLHCAELYDFDH